MSSKTNGTFLVYPEPNGTSEVYLETSLYTSFVHNISELINFYLKISIDKYLLIPTKHKLIRNYIDCITFLS